MDTKDAGRKGGLSKSPHKGKTARANGAKGGRPKKRCVTCLARFRKEDIKDACTCA